MVRQALPLSRCLEVDGKRAGEEEPQNRGEQSTVYKFWKPDEMNGDPRQTLLARSASVMQWVLAEMNCMLIG